VKPEHSEEELPERVEHLDKKVPPQAHVRGQVRDQQVEAIGSCHEFPEVPSDENRKS
jgi:hypothetical protein